MNSQGALWWDTLLASTVSKGPRTRQSRYGRFCTALQYWRRQGYSGNENRSAALNSDCGCGSKRPPSRETSLASAPALEPRSDSGTRLAARALRQAIHHAMIDVCDDLALLIGEGRPRHRKNHSSRTAG